MTLRKALFWTHLAAGCVGGLVVLAMSLTGVLLMYERQILAGVERGAFRSAAQVEGARRLPVEELLRLAASQGGSLPREATLTLRSDPREPAEISAGREGAVYLDPYTGRLLGKPSHEWRDFFRKVTVWHRWLGAEGEGRALGKAITGACNLAFLGLVLTGLYLWIPKQWTWKRVAPVAWFRGGLTGKARDFNWHNVLGLWAAAPLVFVVASAAPMSYPWANDLLYRITGTEPPAGGPRRPGGPGRPPRGAADAAKPDWTGLNALWLKAEERSPHWRSIAMRLPESPRRPVSFVIDTGDGGQPQRRTTLTMDRATGEIERAETFDSLNAGRRLRMWTRFVHTGEAFGVAGQTVAGVASAAAVMLVWTGMTLSLRRFTAWRRRRIEMRYRHPLRI